MRVWIIKENEFTAMLSGKARASRAAMLAEYFVDAGNEVVAWSSLWIHDAKTYINEQRKKIEIKKGLIIHIIPSEKTYKKNVSFSRIAQEREIGRNFISEIQKEPLPDLIYSCWPLMETSFAAVKFANDHGIPVIIDIRDLWPDIFIQPVSDKLKSIAGLVIDLLFKKHTQYVMQNADMVTGTIPKAIVLAERYGRNLNENDKCVFHCYKKPVFNDDEIRASLKFWKEHHGVDDRTFNIVLFCSIRKRIMDFDTLFAAAEKLQGAHVKFIICGKGESYEEVKEKASSLDNVVVPGLMPQRELWSLASISEIGLLPYFNTFDFEDSLPTKFSEYLASSLIILTSMTGLSKTVVEENRCGFYYGSPDDLVALILKLRDDNTLFEKMRWNSQDLFKKSFNADIVYKSFVTELMKLAHSSRRQIQ